MFPESGVQPTQHFPSKPPFAQQSFTEKKINPFATAEEQDAIRELLKNSRNEGLYTPPSLRGAISAPGHNGGVDWGMVAVNPSKGFLYIITKEHPTLDKQFSPGARHSPASLTPPAAPEPPAPPNQSFTRTTRPSTS